MDDKVLIITITSLGNRIPFLLELRESILAQSVDNYHWYIYIHGVSLDVFNYFSERYAIADKITFIHDEPRHEIYDARNNAVAHAKNKEEYNFIMNIDDDDLLPVDALENHINVLRKNKEADFSLGMLVDMNVFGLLYHEYHLPLPEGKIGLEEMQIGWPFPQAGIPAASHMAMFRSLAFDKVEGYPTCNGDDIAIIINMVRAGLIGFNHQKIVYHYRDWDGQVMKTEDFLKQDEIMRKNLHELLHKK